MQKKKKKAAELPSRSNMASYLQHEQLKVKKLKHLESSESMHGRTKEALRKQGIPREFLNQEKVVTAWSIEDAQ